ncbi:MAG: hypothetical protein KDD42_04560, partial [Bdellovibrionales bacterium]|nr:hypothetical protein [Bdellovibrionales bacterium]
MDSAGVLGIFALGIAIISGGAVAYYYFFPRQESNLRSLMGRIDQPGSGVVREMRQRLREDETGEQLAAVKKITKKKRQVKKEQVSLEDRFFRAGMFSKSEQKD